MKGGDGGWCGRRRAYDGGRMEEEMERHGDVVRKCEAHD